MARRRVDQVELKRTESNGYEFVVGAYDYHIKFEDGVWRLDQFDRSIDDADEAHLQTVEVESLADGIHFALEEPHAGRIDS
jgi:hypothetical protein